MFPRNLVHSAYRIMHGPRRQIMHYQFTFFDHFLFEHETHQLRCDANTFASAPICGKGTCLLVRLLSYSVVCDARSSPNEHHQYSFYFQYCPTSFPSLFCIYERTYLSCRTSLSSLSYLPRKIVEVGSRT